MIRKMANKYVYPNLPPPIKTQVDEWYEDKGKKQVKAYLKKTGVKNPRQTTLDKINQLLMNLKEGNLYLTSNDDEFKGPYRTNGFNPNDPKDMYYYNKAPAIAKWYAQNKTPLPPPKEVELPPTFYELLEREIKEIGHPMKYPERRASWEKALTDILEHTKNNVSNLTQEDLKMAEKFKEIMSVDYKEYPYTDPVTREVKQGRGSSTTGAKGRHMDEIDSIIQYIRENMSDEELKSWQQTLKASQSLADYISRILEEMGYDTNQIKVS